MQPKCFLFKLADRENPNKMAILHTLDVKKQSEADQPHSTFVIYYLRNNGNRIDIDVVPSTRTGILEHHGMCARCKHRTDISSLILECSVRIDGGHIIPIHPNPDLTATGMSDVVVNEPCAIEGEGGGGAQVVGAVIGSVVGASHRRECRP